MQTTPTWLRLTEKELAELDAIAAEQERSRAAQLRYIVLQAIKQQPETAPTAQKGKAK